MLVALDVHYGDTSATTALVGFAAWTAASASLERVVRSEVAPAPRRKVRAMHGAHRIPTLLRRVDHLTRGLP